MRRRDLARPLLLVAAAPRVRAEQAKPRRIAIVIPSGSVDRISAVGGSRFYGAIFEELRQLGDVERETLTVSAFPVRGGSSAGSPPFSPRTSRATAGSWVPMKKALSRN